MKITIESSEGVFTIEHYDDYEFATDVVMNLVVPVMLAQQFQLSSVLDAFEEVIEEYRPSEITLPVATGSRVSG